MRPIIWALALITAILASPASVRAEERHGIQVYEGARLDAAETKFLREIAGADGYFYRTGDSVEKVTAFYQKQPGLTSLGSNESGAWLVKEEGGHTVHVKIQSPWQPAAGGPMNEDTSILIAKE